jgi:hypothetical protein
MSDGGGRCSPPAVLDRADVVRDAGAVPDARAGLSFATYCLFIFLFEVAFTRVNNEIIVTTPIESMGYVAAFNQGCNTALMAIVIVGASAAIDASSVQLVTCVLASTALVAGCLIARRRFSARSS